MSVWTSRLDPESEACEGGIGRMTRGLCTGCCGWSGRMPA